MDCTGYLSVTSCIGDVIRLFGEGQLKLFKSFTFKEGKREIPYLNSGVEMCVARKIASNSSA
jgi:hypothetical protein